MIIMIVTIILFYISIRLAEKSSGNNVYIFIIAGCVIVLVSRLLMNLNLWSSLEKDYNATPQELVNKSVKMEKYYVGEIIMLIAGIIFFSCGYKEYVLAGFDKISIVYFIGTIISLFIIIKNLINKKTRIEKITNTNFSEQNNLKINNKVVVCFVIVLIVLSYLYKLFN